MNFLDPGVFLFSSTLVSLSIMLMLVVSRPGLAEDQPALALWVAGDLMIILHRVVLLLQPGVIPPRDSTIFNWPTIDFVVADASFLMLALVIWTKSLSLICDRRLGRAATAALFAVPVVVMVAMRLLGGVLPVEIVVFVAAGALPLLHIFLAWKKRRMSRGLTILTAANGVIVAMMAAGLLATLAHLNDTHGAPAQAPAGPFFPPLMGICSDFIASIVRTFAISLVLQERQRAHITMLSTTDALTGTLNRRGAMPLLQQALDGALRYRQPISIAVLDIDHFKHVNDRFGHEAGDAVLAAFAHGLKTGTRSCDVLARWGGEEFVLLMPNTALRQAAELLDRIRQDMPRLLDPADLPCAVSFSAGVASLADKDAQPSLAELLAVADKCLYQAKLTRDCVVAEDAADAAVPTQRPVASLSRRRRDDRPPGAEERSPDGHEAPRPT